MLTAFLLNREFNNSSPWTDHSSGISHSLYRAQMWQLARVWELIILFHLLQLTRVGKRVIRERLRKSEAVKTWAGFDIGNISSSSFLEILQSAVLITKHTFVLCACLPFHFCLYSCWAISCFHWLFSSSNCAVTKSGVGFFCYCEPQNWPCSRRDYCLIFWMSVSAVCSFLYQGLSSNSFCTWSQH